MQVIDDFLEGFLGFILTGHILEGLAGLGGNVHLGIAFAETHHVAPAQFRPQVPHDQLADYHKQQERQDPVVEEGHNGRFLFWDYLREFHLGLYQTADQFRVIHPSRYVNLFLSILIAQKGDPILGDFHLGGFSLIHHVQEIGIADLMDFRLKEHGTDDRIDNQDQQNGCDVIQSDSLRLLVRIFVIHDIFILSAGVLHAFLLIIAQTIVKNNRNRFSVPFPDGSVPLSIIYRHFRLFTFLFYLLFVKIVIVFSPLCFLTVPNLHRFISLKRRHHPCPTQPRRKIPRKSEVS